jgi:hypothetical protein
MEKIALIDITNHESEIIGQLIDLIHEHLNEYELDDNELKTLNESDEILFRLYTLHNLP